MELCALRLSMHVPATAHSGLGYANSCPLHRLGGAGAAKARKSCRSRRRRLYRWAAFRETCKSHGRSQTGDGQTPVGQRGARLKKSNLRSRPDAALRGAWTGSERERALRQDLLVCVEGRTAVARRAGIAGIYPQLKTFIPPLCPRP
jgi:hypothetical protein